MAGDGLGKVVAVFVGKAQVLPGVGVIGIYFLSPFPVINRLAKNILGLPEQALITVKIMLE